ncbi:winged helix-turn-helix domain-containing protein [Ruminococcaceae bacterium OttesenSCG-928-L11]|nr:winged helix-turn-helix domain-containing protein [Ruminococcaceae bacterium OttesenSCG-928-L11]
MVVNDSVSLLFIDYTEQYMKIVKEMLDKGRRLPGEVIHLVHSIPEGVALLQEKNDIELVVLHAVAKKNPIRRALTKLRQVSLAEIMLISLFEDQDDISEIYRYGMNMLVPPIYKPEMAVAYFESFYDRRRLLPGISSMKEIEHIKDHAKMQCGDLMIDPARFVVERSDRKIDLTAMEFKLLYFFACNEGIVFTEEQIFESVWKTDFSFNSSISNRIYRLRQKIEPDSKNPTYILTIYGVGYKFMAN